MQKIDIFKQPSKFLKNLPPKQQRQVAERMHGLLLGVHPLDSKKLKGIPFHRIDVGEYRVVYEWNETTVFIVVVGKRNDSHVYRLLERQ